MTTTDSTTAPTARTITHPDWCWPRSCTARLDEDGCRVGYHYNNLSGFTTLYGPEIRLHLVDDAFFDCTDSARIGMVTLAHEDDVPGAVRDTGGEHDWRLENGSSVWFEPEEARMLARFLISAAAKWDAAQTGLAQ